ncbi:failed axon connections-like [Panonychus citri]|uniref:failed axon connections-like n=1 Tax=Panonychus citri TaxID=50023 RepID=UPI002306E6D6|nr:failed axon connections-like [Panonychus citri]
MTSVVETAPAVVATEGTTDSKIEDKVGGGDTNNTNNSTTVVGADDEQSKKTTEATTEESNKDAVTGGKPKPSVHKVDFEEGKVYLYQFERCASLPSSSSHCLKLETFLRMANIPYENVDHKMRYKSSKGDMPFVELNGREIAETDAIIEELSKEFKIDLNSDLTGEQKVIAHALESMLENHTAWIIKHWRFKHPQEFLKVSGTDIKKTINSKLPQSVLNFMFKIGFKSNIKDLIGHGIGRHDAEQVYATGRKDLEMLSNALGDKQYFFGDKPRLLDAEVFSILAQFIFVPFENYDEFIKNDTSNLFKFVERMKEQYWKDWDTICQAVEVESGKKEGESEDTKKSDEAIEEEKKKKEELKKEKEEKKRKEKEEREKKKKEEKEEKERKKREAKEKAEKEKAEKEKAEKEKAEKEKAEKEKAEQEKKEAEAKAEGEKGTDGGDKADKSGGEVDESQGKSEAGGGGEVGEKSAEKKDDTKESEGKSG